MSDELKWFLFRQNNSGGSFVTTSELCHYVFIQARDDVAALAKGLDMGIYLNGCADGTDCSCCGDRWSEPEELKFPMDYGDGVVLRSVEEYAARLAGSLGGGWTNPDGRLYYADGRKEEVRGRDRRARSEA